MIPPIMTRKTNNTQSTGGNDRPRTFQVERSETGATLGLIRAQP